MVNVVRLRLSVLYTPIEKLWNALNVDMRSIQQFNDFIRWWRWRYFLRHQSCILSFCFSHQGSLPEDDKIEEQKCSRSVLEGLAFPEEAPRRKFASDVDDLVPCMFCDRTFVNTEGKNNALLHHLLVGHQLVITDVAQVCDMKRCLDRLACH